MGLHFRQSIGRHDEVLPLAPPGERVIVVGAGIAGLAAAFRLRQAGFEVLVLEANEHVGGRMATIERQGYRLDVAASALSTAYREMVKLIQDAGLEAEVEPFEPTIGVVRDGKIHRLNTASKIDMLRSDVLSTRSKIAITRVARDVVRARHVLNYDDFSRISELTNLGTETATEYARRRLNQELLDCFVEPACEAWYFCQPDVLSTASLLWHLKNFWLGRLFSSPAGIGFVAEGLARHVDVVLGARVKEVEEGPAGVRVSWEDPTRNAERVEEASSVVIALPSHEMVKVYPQLDAVRRDIANGLEYGSSLHIYLGLSRVPSEPCSWVVYPKREHESCFWTMFEHRKGMAPAGKRLMGAWFRSSWVEAHWDLDDDKVLDAGMSILGEVHPDVLDDVEMTYVHRVKPCLLRHRPGLYGDLAKFAAATDPGSRIQLAGDYFPVTSTNSCARSGELAADRLARRVGTRTSGSIGPRA